MSAPVIDKVAVDPEHIDVLLAVAFKVGRGLTLIEIVSVELKQFAVSPITVYVVNVVGVTTTELVVTIKGFVKV